MRTRSAGRTGLVSGALPLACVFVLALNDHVLKAQFPGLLTGKISDFAGLFFFPLLLVDVAHLVPGVRARAAIVTACLLTALVFALVKTWGPAHEAYCVGLGALQWPFFVVRANLLGQGVPAIARVRLTMDATDLVALVSIAFAYRYERSRSGSSAPASAVPRTGPAA